MKLNKLLIISLLSCTFSCGGGKYNDIPLDKRYWTPDDYDVVVFAIRYKSNPDESLPTFENPETRLILEKLTDSQNYLVVLDDSELGIKYRNEVAERFFSEWRDMNKIYWEMNRQDKYLYPYELVECYKFGLGLQLKYFQLGNDSMMENAVDPNSQRLKRIVSDNIGTLISNYGNYIDLIKNEDSFSEKSLESYAEGLDEYFTLLINQYPDKNYKGIKNKLELLNQRVTSTQIKNVVEKLNSLIDELEDTKTF